MPIKNRTHNVEHRECLYWMNIKSNHVRLLLIIQQCVRSCAWSFIQLLNSKTYTLSHRVLLNYLWLWQKYAVWTETIHHSVRESCRTGCKRTVPSSLKFSWFESAGLASPYYLVQGAMLEKYHELQPKPKMTDELWRSPCRPSGKNTARYSLLKLACYSLL